MLNIFSYTGSLGIACLKGGASQVVHIDSQRAMERRIARNYELNDLAWDERALRVGDAYRILRDFRQRERQFDLVILDPPPESNPRARGGNPGSGLPRPAKTRGASGSPRGILLTFLNQRGVSSEMHHSGVQRGERGFCIPPVDCGKWSGFS